MSSKSLRRSRAIAGGVALFLSGSAFHEAGGAEPRPPFVSGASVELPAVLQLDPPTGRELARANSSRSASGASPVAVDMGTANGPIAAPLETRITRQVDRLWRIRLSEKETGSSPDFDVRCDVMSPGGESGVLSSVDGSSVIVVRVIPRPPVEAYDAGRRYLEGGAILELDFARAVRPGAYNGALVVSLLAR